MSRLNLEAIARLRRQGGVVVIPCSRDKLKRPAPARDLYTGSMFRASLAAALAPSTLPGAARDSLVLVLSALHGLVQLGNVLVPYNVTMRDSGSIAVEALKQQAAAFALARRDVYALLPRRYLDRLRTACPDVVDLFDGCRGIGEQRKVCRVLRTGRCDFVDAFKAGAFDNVREA